MRRHPTFALALSCAFLAIVLAALAALGCNQSERTLAERRGAHLYQKMCAVCHGERGGGYKADQAPAITHPDFLTSASNEFLQKAIAFGRSGTTMSAWGVERGGPLGPADVDALVAFIRTWDRRPAKVLDERPISGDAGRGAGTFARECARCHGDRGIGGTYVNIGKPQLLTTASNGFLRHAIRHGRPGTAMVAFGPSLGDPAIEDILALMRSWPLTSPTEPPPAPAPPPPIPLGPVPLHPNGPEPVGFHTWPATTPADVIKGQLDRHARMAVLDARAPSDYTNEHIAGAVSVPFYDPEPYLASLPKSAWLVCYCACPHAESGQLAQKLIAKGFTKVTVLDEGLGFWKMKKYETHSGLLE